MHSNNSLCAITTNFILDKTLTGRPSCSTLRDRHRPVNPPAYSQEERAILFYIIEKDVIESEISLSRSSENDTPAFPAASGKRLVSVMPGIVFVSSR